MTDRGVDAALAPVREALLRRAETAASATLAEAEDAAAALATQARARADTLLSAAREAGRTDAAIALAQARAESRRRTRALELASQREVYERLRGRARDAVGDLRHSAQYPAMRSALAAHAREVLGPDTTVQEAPDGGIVARADGRRVDYSLGALAERALGRSLGDLEELWTP